MVVAVREEAALRHKAQTDQTLFLALLPQRAEVVAGLEGRAIRTEDQVVLEAVLATKTEQAEQETPHQHHQVKAALVEVLTLANQTLAQREVVGPLRLGQLVQIQRVGTEEMARLPQYLAHR